MILIFGYIVMIMNFYGGGFLLLGIFLFFYVFEFILKVNWKGEVSFVLVEENEFGLIYFCR